MVGCVERAEDPSGKWCPLPGAEAAAAAAAAMEEPPAPEEYTVLVFPPPVPRWEKLYGGGGRPWAAAATAGECCLALPDCGLCAGAAASVGRPDWGFRLCATAVGCSLGCLVAAAAAAATPLESD